MENIIKEMAKSIDEALIHNVSWSPDNGVIAYSAEGIARELFDDGYRKQKEGEWIDQYQGMYVNQLYKCSVCGETAFHDDKRWFLTKFCPNCGAKMKGGAE